MRVERIVVAGGAPCDTVDVIRSGELWYNIWHEEAAREQALRKGKKCHVDFSRHTFMGLFTIGRLF